MPKNLIITGPTATGKTELAVSLAEKYNGEIVSADSRQVYRGMDIGTGKDLKSYSRNGREIPFHLIDIVPPDEEYNLMRFTQDAASAIENILKKGKLPIIAGGTPLYIDALISEYKMEGGGVDKNLRNSLKELETEKLLKILESTSSEAYEKLNNSQNRNRIIRIIEKLRTEKTEHRGLLPTATEWLILGVYYHRKTVHSRIEERLKERAADGMIEEVEYLHNKEGVSWERLEFFGLEYKYIALFLQGKLSYNEMYNQLLIKIRQFAKRQDIWFRKMEREGHIIHWIPDGDITKASELVEKFLNDIPLPAPEIRISEIDYGISEGKNA